MQWVRFQFHGRLSAFLSPPAVGQEHAQPGVQSAAPRSARNGILHSAKRSVPYPLSDRTAVKHAIEAQGVPHTEVESILLNGAPVTFSYILSAGDDLDVYPAPFETALEGQLRPPLSYYPPRFVADNHLGRLVRTLRLLGFDVLYPKHLADEELAELASREERVLLTRDRGLLMRKIVVYGFCLQTRDPRRQLIDVMARYKLQAAMAPWQRCLRCNGQLERVAKEEIVERLQPKTKQYYHEFHMCPDCRQIYWKGSHYRPLNDIIKAVSDESSAADSPK